MYSKGQLEINETILVLIVLSILAIAGVVIFHRYMLSGIEATSLEYKRQSFNNLLNYVPNMPELKCSSQNIQEECIDLLKMISFSNHQASYISKFGYKTITIKLVYPEKKEKLCQQEDIQSSSFPDCNKIIIYERKLDNFKASEKIASPVAVYNPLDNSYLLALMEVEWQY